MKVDDPAHGSPAQQRHESDARQALRESERRGRAERSARLTAERENEVARLKGEISLALGDITDTKGQVTALQQVANLIAKGFGDWCVIHVAEPGEARRIAAHSDWLKPAWAQAFSTRWRPQPDSTRGHFAVMRSGQAQWFPRVSDQMLVETAVDSEHLAALRAMDITSYLCVPMHARQRIVGTLACVRTGASPAYDESDLSFAQQIGDRVALAIDNSRLYREAQEARETAERLYVAERRARAEAEALARVAQALSEAGLDLDAVVQRVTDEATALVGAQFGAFFYNVVGDQGEEYMLYTLSGAPRAAFEKLGLPRNTPIFAPTFAGVGVVRLDDVKQDPRYGTMSPHHGMPKGHLPVTSYLAVPVVSRTGPVIGGLFFGHSAPGRFTEQHERIGKVLAGHASLAIDNARVFQAAREGEERQGRLVGELERAVRFSEMFVGNLGHDLRNPLSAITTAASVVLSRADSDRVAKPVSRILSSADRMSRMIDQILDFTRVRLGGGIQLSRKPLELADLCRVVLEELRSEGHDDPRPQLELHGSSSGEWDEDRLAQLVSNLAGNALQHRSPGTPVSICIDGSRPDRVTLSVHNSGSVPPDLLPVIFEPLRGREGGKREGSSGLGLGLYISQQIALAHGGSIRVDSEPGADHTRFDVDLPRSPRAPQQTQENVK
jgi:signal transduction histidine kinase